MNFLFASDSVVYDGLELAIYTLLTHNKGVNIYIFTMTITQNDNGNERRFSELLPWQVEQIKKVVKYLDPTSNITIMNVASYYKDLIEGGVNELNGFTPYASLRLIVDKALPYVDDILYLDCDTAVQGDLRGMYYDYLEKGHEYCASFAYDACEGKGEMVSGVLLMNIALMRKNKTLELARDKYKKHKYHYPDQMALDNTVKAYPLPETYGYMDALEDCNYNPMILHFTNKLNPKIYSTNNKGINNKVYFYRRYPQFKYVDDGVEMIKKICMFI